MTVTSSIASLSPGEALRFQAFNAKGIEAVKAGNPGGALAHYEEALQILRDPALLGNYGDALARCARIEDARRAFEESIALAPDYAMSRYNLAVMHDQLGDYETARQHYHDALVCRVDPRTLNNLGNACTYTLRLEEAEDAYRRAIKYRYFDSVWNLALCLMMQGRWAEAWQFYEHRPQMRDYHDHPLLWRGESVSGKHLVVITEQGLGDSIFAMRYIPMLREMGATVTFACEPTLMRLARAAFPPSDSLPAVHVMDRTTGAQPAEAAQYVTLAMSLPGLLTPDGTGPTNPYLIARPVRMEGFNVGICWNGSTEVGPPALRNIPLKLLKPLSEIDGVRLVSLQRGTAEAEMADCGFEVHDAMAGVRDVYDTACVIASLDLVITVDTLIPHLAGALGKPVWLMNRWMSCWQWGTPSYDPSLYGGFVAQFRQAAPRDWDYVVRHITHGLKHIAASRVEVAT